VVGQAGKPRTISGFQTHQTPVRLATTERAELATEEYIPFGHVLEGFVILQKNPGWEKEDKMDTFRTVHPLLSIISPHEWAEIVNAYVDGWWHTGLSVVPYLSRSALT
jgi:hypothetical protein